MKTGVVVIYVPLIEAKEAKDVMNQNLQKMKDSDFYKTFDILYIGDPARQKVEIEVFFNPYYKQ